MTRVSSWRGWCAIFLADALRSGAARVSFDYDHVYRARLVKRHEGSWILRQWRLLEVVITILTLRTRKAEEGRRWVHRRLLYGSLCCSWTNCCSFVQVLQIRGSWIDGWDINKHLPNNVYWSMRQTDAIRKPRVNREIATANIMFHPRITQRELSRIHWNVSHQKYSPCSNEIQTIFFRINLTVNNT